MFYFVLAIVIFFVASFYVYRRSLISYKDYSNGNSFYTSSIENCIGKVKLKDSYKTILFFGVAFLFRAVVAYIVAKNGYRGFETDINCFIVWSEYVFKHGVSTFYSSDMFSDYPPGYIYILYVVGALRQLFNIDSGSAMMVVLIKIPAILADIGIGYIVYDLAKDRFSRYASFLLALLFLVNPSVFLDSVIWGQVDSVFMFFLVLMCYLIYRDKIVPSYFVYGLSILIKPQALMFFPVILFAYWDKIISRRSNKKHLLTDIFTQTGFALAAVGTCFLLMVPFGFESAFAQYTSTISSYPYASVNAYNIWALFDKIWASQYDKFLGATYQTWGNEGIVLTVIGAGIVSFLSRRSKSKYLFIGAFLAIGVFTLSVRMHERYVFPALVFSFLAFVMRPRIKTFILFVASTLVSFFNMVHVLFYYDPNNFNFQSLLVRSVSFMMILVFAWCIYTAVTVYCKCEEGGEKDKSAIKAQCDIASAYYERREKNRKQYLPTRAISRMTKKDYIIVAIILVIYTIPSFINLGATSAPNTQYSLVNEGSVYLDFGSVQHITELWSYNGHEFDQSYDVNFSEDGDNWYILFPDEDPWNTNGLGVYRWNKTDVDFTARYLYIEPASNNYSDAIIEFVFRNDAGNMVTPVNASDYPNLFDEQDMMVDDYSFANGTYFDEIHYTRTIYELRHGLYTYENTHPQLGKEIMTLGTMIFGMNPFGWRFMGTVCGIIMIFAMYLLGKRFFEDTKLAAISAIIFGADFMRFVQSRIATIDVYVVMFIIFSYVFMYEYTQFNFFDTPRQKSYKTLLTCGLFMGLAIASKWTGVYSAAGLAFLFFAQFVNRYKEYDVALNDIGSKTTQTSSVNKVKSFIKNINKTVLFCLVAFIAIPGVLYILTYIPFNDGVEGRGLITKFIEAQKTMFNYHTQLVDEHYYSSKWYQWPVLYKPMLFVFEAVTDTTRRVITSMGNPLIWWPGIPAFFFMVYLWMNERDRKAGFLIVGYLAQYLPWVLVERTTFIYHYFGSVPFITLMCIYSLVRIGEKKPKLKKAVYVYCALTVIAFIMFYPVISGTEVSIDYINKFLKWSNLWAM